MLSSQVGAFPEAEESLLGHSAACYSDSADSDQSKNYSKKRFSPFQVETLKRVFGQSPYITQSQAAALARRTGLKKLQVRKWFSDYRCKIKKQSVLLERFSSAHAAAMAAAAAAAPLAAADDGVAISLLDDEDPIPEPEDGKAEVEQEDEVQEEEEDAEEEEEEDEEEEDGAEVVSEEGEEEADADEDTDVETNTELDQMIATRSIRPITIVFGKRSRKRAKKREKERPPSAGVAGGGAKRGRKKKKLDGGNEGGGSCSLAAEHHSSQSQTVKRFSPHQVEMLKKAYADSPYITQRQAAVLARNIGLKKMQVRKWFCDHRCKIKKQSQRLQAEGFGSQEACDRRAAATLEALAQVPTTRKSLLERLAGSDQSVGGDPKEEEDENVDFTDSDDPLAANGLLEDDPKGADARSIPKVRISLPRRTFRFNEKQLKVLNEEFDKSQFLNEDTLSFLCDKLQERRERIQTWFKMRRYKLRQSEQRFWQNIIDSS